MAAWRDGGPPPDRDPDLATHLGQCDACGAALEDLVGASDEQTVARAFASIETRPGFAARVLARLAGEADGQAPVAAKTGSDDDDDEFDALLAAGTRYAGRGPAGRTGMGMVIEYCAECRERIDAADFRSGVAIQFKGQSYCRGCKDGIVERFADDPEFQAQQRRTQREHARPSDRAEEEDSGLGSGVRRGAGRGVRHAPAARSGPGGGPNLMVLGGVAAGVLVLIVGAVFMFSGGGGDAGKPGGRETTTSTGDRRPGPGGKRSPADQRKGTDPPSPTPAPGPSMEEQERLRVAIESLRKKRAELEDFAKANMRPEDWEDVDLRYRNFLADGDWKLAPDDASVKALRAQTEADQKMARDRFENEGNAAISRAISTAIGMATRGAFGQAMNALDSVPMIFSSLERYKEIGETREKIDKMAAERMGRVGEWKDVVKGPADVSQLLKPQGDDATSVVWDNADQCAVVKTTTRAATIFFTDPASDGWVDYELEFEAKATNRIQFCVRVTVNQESRSYQGSALTFDENDFAEYHKYLVKVEGQKLIVHVDGKPTIDAPSNWRRGKPMLLLPQDSEFRVRSLRFKVLKVLGQ